MAGHIQSVLRMYPLGISGSHSGVYLKCTQHLITGHIGVTCCLCSQCIHNVPSGYLGPCPQCEQLQETLRPLYVSPSVCVTLLNPCSAPDSGATNGRGGIVSLTSTRAGNPLLKVWQMPTSVGNIQMILGSFQMKHNVHPHNPHNPRPPQVTSSPSPLLSPAVILLHPGYLVLHTATCRLVALLSQPLLRLTLRSRSLISTLCQHQSRFHAWRIRLPHQPLLAWDM